MNDTVERRRRSREHCQECQVGDCAHHLRENYNAVQAELQRIRARLTCYEVQSSAGKQLDQALQEIDRLTAVVAERECMLSKALIERAETQEALLRFKRLLSQDAQRASFAAQLLCRARESTDETETSLILKLATEVAEGKWQS